MNFESFFSYTFGRMKDVTEKTIRSPQIVQLEHQTFLLSSLRQ